MSVRKITRFLRRDGREVTKWVADYRLADGSRCMPEFDTRREAQEECARQKLLQSTDRERHKKLLAETQDRAVRTIEELVGYYVDTVCAHWTIEARKDLRSRLRPFVQWSLDRGVLYVHQFTRTHALEYREFVLTEAKGVRGHKIALRTAEHWLIAASSAFQAELDYQEPSAITRNPFAKVKKSLARKHEPVLIDREHLKLFLSCASEFDYHLFRLEYAGGFRADELRNLTWKQVSSTQIRMTTHEYQPKTETSGHSIEVNQFIAESLAWFRLRSGTKKYVLDPETFVRPGGHKGPRLDRVGKNFIADRFAMVRRRAQERYPDIDWSRLTPHKLRTAYGSHLAELNVPLTTVQRLMRHKNYSTTARWYVGVAPKHAQDSAKVLDQIDLSREAA